jgi:hypothetical protein
MRKPLNVSSIAQDSDEAERAKSGFELGQNTETTHDWTAEKATVPFEFGNTHQQVQAQNRCAD